MERRTFLTLLTITPMAGVLAACGSDDTAEPASTDGSLPLVTSPETTEPPTTVTAESDPQTPVVVTDAIIEFGYYGGFTTREVAFQMQPQLVVTTDGHLITPAPTPAIFPGPLLPADSIQTITQDGIDALIAAARDAGLLADLSYEPIENIADASTATLRLTVDGTTYVHEAYALGIGGLDDDLSSELGGGGSTNRSAFEGFADLLGNVEAIVGADALGDPEPYRPSSYQLLAEPAGSPADLEADAVVVDWPASTGVTLAGTTECTSVDAANVRDLLDAATQLTYFTEDGVAYRLVARPSYPGRSC